MTRTWSQLESKAWQTREAAETELRRNGFASRLDRLAEGKLGLWVISDQVPSPAPGPAATAAGPKGGRKKGPHAADAADLAKIAAATDFSVHMRVSPTKVFDEKAPTLDEARAIAARLNADHGKSGRRAMIYALQEAGPGIPVPADYDPPQNGPQTVAGGAEGSGLFQDDPAADAAGTQETAGEGVSDATPDAVGPNDLSPMGDEDRPYHLVIRVPQFGVAAAAQQIALAINLPVEVVNIKGATLRTLSHFAASKIPPRAARRKVAAAARKGAVKATGKSAEAVKLLRRPAGATKAQIVKVTEWSFGERYIRRLAATHGLEMVTIEKDHWRLIVPATKKD